MEIIYHIIRHFPMVKRKQFLIVKERWGVILRGGTKTFVKLMK